MPPRFAPLRRLERSRFRLGKLSVELGDAFLPDADHTGHVDGGTAVAVPLMQHDVTSADPITLLVQQRLRLVGREKVTESPIHFAEPPVDVAERVVVADEVLDLGPGARAVEAGR